MKRNIFLLTLAFLVATLGLLTNCDSESGTPAGNREPWELPQDLAYVATDEQAATFAWETFIAMNWPGSMETPGEPLQDQPFGADRPVVWETWIEVFDLFDTLPGGAYHVPKWEDPNRIPQVCADFDPGNKVLHQASKVSDLLVEREQAVGGAIMDLNGNLARYEVRVNKPMFDFIVENELYNALKQATFPEEKFRFPNGSIELKGSWKKMTKNDDFSRFHTAHSLVYDPKKSIDCLPEKEKKKENKDCQMDTMGLVGLHVVYRIPSAPMSVWMTFEQVDNTNDTPEGQTPSFYDPNCTTCPQNTRFCDNPDQNFTQITRFISDDPGVKKSDEATARVNEKFQNSELIKGTVWEHYKLVGIQYPTDTAYDRVGKPNRRQLANTTMETFNQSASSCVGCHAFARSKNPAFLSDFSWMMDRAKPPKGYFPGPDATTEEIIYYVSFLNPYKKWKVWPNDQWNRFDKPMGGENPHGKTVNLYVNDIAYNYAIDTDKGNPVADSTVTPVLPVGSIIVKENFRVPFPMRPTPSDLIEVTIMFKQAEAPGPNHWVWIKTTPNGTRIDNQGADESCFSCHAWEGNGDFMLLFNFGKKPVIQTHRVDSLLLEQADKNPKLSDKEKQWIESYLKGN